MNTTTQTTPKTKAPDYSAMGRGETFLGNLLKQLEQERKGA